MTDLKVSPMFSFHIGCRCNTDIFNNEASFGPHMLYYADATTIVKSSNDKNEVIILGHITSLSNKGVPSVAEAMAKCDDLDSLLSVEYDCGGKYVIFAYVGGRSYVITDATSSVPVYYLAEGADTFVCSSSMKLIADSFNLSKDDKHMHIRNSGDISQAMPYDITEYKCIKQLLPNHAFHIDTHTAVRFVNESVYKGIVPLNDAVKITSPLISKLTEYYLSLYDIACPITDGKDSRVVLSQLFAQGKRFPCYTIDHNSGSAPQVIEIPKKLCDCIDLEYRVLSDATLTDEDIAHADDMLGKGSYSARTLMIAKTIKEAFPQKAILNGDIVGQVGKCSLHRDIPEFLATPSYFRCKLHNYSKESKKLLKAWKKEIYSSGECTNVFDLFSVESRLGRWACQENTIYNFIALPYLNIFNSRSIIYVWTKVKRTQRKKAFLNIELIKGNCEKLLSVPFEMDSFTSCIAKSNWLMYYISSYIKYFVQKLAFKLKKRG